MSLNPDSIIAVIGAGAMGSGIAQVAAQAGHPVIVVDADGAVLERSRLNITKNLEGLVSRAKIDATERDAILRRMRWTVDLADVAPAALIIEAIVEDLRIKIQLFDTLVDIASDDAILVSNTSSLSINQMAENIRTPQRFAGLHFFNPVPAMKLVEVVPGNQTHEVVSAALLTLMAAWGKVGVRVRDVPGFIVNRVARPYYAEGFAALGEGIDPTVIDHALMSAGGFRMGPLALADLIGHDVNYVVARSIHDAYEGQTRFRPQRSQQALFESGKLGRKSGSGVYDYSADLPDPVYATPGSTPAAIDIAEHHAGIAQIVKLARAGAIETLIDATLPCDSLRLNGIVIALGDGRSLASRKNVDVLIDHARDYTLAPAWVITSRDDAAAHVAAGFAQALDKKLILLPDRPGQIVLRTLAQLANAAADAVADQVASAQDIDAAMRFGANHPEGPLEWATRFGHARLAAALDAIADALHDDMFRPAPCLKAAQQ